MNRIRNCYNDSAPRRSRKLAGQPAEHQENLPNVRPASTMRTNTGKRGDHRQQSERERRSSTAHNQIDLTWNTPDNLREEQLLKNQCRYYGNYGNNRSVSISIQKPVFAIGREPLVAGTIVLQNSVRARWRR